MQSVRGNEHFSWYSYEDRPFFYTRYNERGMIVEEACWYDNRQLATYEKRRRGKTIHYERYDWHGACLNHYDGGVEWSEREILTKCASELNMLKSSLNKQNSNV